MTEQKQRQIMTLFIVVGIVLVAMGVLLAIFTDIVTTRGISGIFIVAGLIAGGLLISVPAKIYLTLQLMKLNDDKLMKKNQQ
jgi:hypothetical protein